MEIRFSGRALPGFPVSATLGLSCERMRLTEPALPSVFLIALKTRHIMRVAIIAEVYLPKIDGVVVRTLNLIRELQAAGDEVLVICPEVDGPRNSPVPVVDFSGFCFPMYPEYRIGQPDDRLEAAIREFQPDVVHFLNPFAFGFQCYDRLAAAGFEVATLFSFHTLYAEFAKRYGVLRPLSKWLWWQARHYHNKADVNLTVSDAQVQDLQARGFERVRLWQPAVDTVLFQPETKHLPNGFSPELDCADREQEAEQEGREFRLLTVSRLAPEKNVEFLKEVLIRTPHARLTIVGDGPHRKSLEEHFAGLPVNFVGYLQNRDLAEAYAAADAFVYASETETMGNVILEAMASGLPVIAPRAGGIPSLVRHEHSALLFTPGDAETASDHVRRVRTDQALCSGLTQQAREFAERHGWTAAALRVRDDYSRAITGFRAGPQPLPTTSLAARATTRTLVSVFRTVSRITQNIPAATQVPASKPTTAAAVKNQDHAMQLAPAVQGAKAETIAGLPDVVCDVGVTTQSTTVEC